MDRRRSRSSSRINGKHRFLITGFGLEERARLVRLIRQLDGEYIDDRAFKEQATHLICQQPNRSEKFLGACATGKWILKCSYLEACSSHGSWLPEEPYEWTDEDTGRTVGKHAAVLGAPRRWRRYVAQTERLAFDTWRVVLVIDDVNMRQVFRRLLESGGALAVICKLPPSVDRNVTHIFVKTKTLSYDHFNAWKEQGVPCLAPDYIGDYLVSDGIPPFNTRDIFLCQKLTDSALKAPSKPNLVKDLNENTVRRLDLPVYLNSQESQGSFAFDDPKSESGSTCSSTPAKDIANSGRKYLQVKIQNVENNGSDKKKPHCVETFNANGKIVRKRVFASSSEDSDSNDVTMIVDDKANEIGLRRIPRRPRVNYLKMHCGTITPTDDEKKKNLINRDSSSVEMPVDERVVKSVESSPAKTPSKRPATDIPDPSPRKRRRYNDHVMTFDQHCFLRHRPEKRPSFAMSICVEQMFNTCYEESYYQKALEEFDKYLSVSKYPTAEILWKLMAMLSASTDPKHSDDVYTSLCRLLAMHPPSGSGLQSCYLRAMEYSSNAWGLLMTAVDTCKGANLDEDLDTAQPAYNSALLLKFLTAVLINDLMYCKTSHEKRTPLMCRLLWCASDVGSLNSKVRHLISLVVDAISTNDTTLTTILASLVNCAFDALQLVAKETRLNCGKSELFIAELTNRLALQHCDLNVLERILVNWKDTPLGIGICTSGLDALDNIVFMDRFNDVSLGKILGHYWFSIPKKWTGDCDTENVKPTAKRKQPLTPLSKTVCVNINKRNVKGETKLHRACIKGDSTSLRQLLTVDGIDVNIQDYAGWTPLHEACNHGHVECVRLLLDFKPGKTLESYFKTKVKKQRKVDLIARDPNEGTTPLHDAVANGRIEVARLLLRHGGRKLLEQKNRDGLSPVDLATSDRMREALAESGADDTDGMSSSQNDCSQLSTQSEDMSELYEQNGCLTSTLECRRFLMLLETLLTSYIHVHNLRPQCLVSVHEADQKYLARLPRHVQKLRRHVEKIVVDGGARQSSELQRILTRLELMAESYD